MKSINIDATVRCTLQCPACIRQTYYKYNNKPIPGTDISIESFDKITDYFDQISFCGNISDPTTHPNFYRLLKMCVDKSKKVDISLASSHRSLGWFKRHFLLTRNTPEITWLFAIDGLPKDSHKYRIGQDGEKLFNVMKTASSMGCNVVWKYILFNYNENDVEEAKKLADSINVPMSIIKSVRWEREMIKYRPTNEKNYLTRNFWENYN